MKSEDMRIPIERKNTLTLQEAAIYTGFSELYLYRLTSGRKIPFSKPTGGKLFFSREALDKWLMGSPVKTADELNSEAATYVAKV